MLASDSKLKVIYYVTCSVFTYSFTYTHSSSWKSEPAQSFLALVGQYLAGGSFFFFFF